MGAWIETIMGNAQSPARESHPMWVRGLKQPLGGDVDGGYVAPYVGAWIETMRFVYLLLYVIVAPYVGAWIETALRLFCKYAT